MRAAPHPAQAQRLQALHRYGLLDRPTDDDFDEITRMVAAVCDTPIAVVNLVDEDRQWFMSEHGLGVRQLPLDDSICAHAILEHDYVEIPDTLADCRLQDNPLCTADGGLRFYAGALLRSPDGWPVGTLCVLDRRPRMLTTVQRQTVRTLARQVMARMELHRSLQAQQALSCELAEENARKDEFLATLGHELRNPLAPIGNALALLARLPADDARVPAVHGVIARQHAQLGRLVDDLLDMARLRQGRIAMRPCATTLDVVVQRATEAALPLLEARRHRLHMRLPDGPVPLHVDEARTTQLLGNLLRNAARYTPEGGNVTVRAGVDGACVRIAVEDDGIGIHPDELLHIFRLFGQSDRTSESGGLGIGLTLARRLAELHGGTLEAFSEGVGHGSRFVVKLPRELPA